MKNLSGVEAIYYSNVLKDPLNKMVCDWVDGICGELPAIGTYSFNISSCIPNFFIYAIKSDSAKQVSLTVKFEYLSDKCRGKNATINEKCGSLTITQCQSNTACDTDCQQVNCTDSTGLVLHQLCLPSSLNRTELLARCQSYNSMYSLSIIRFFFVGNRRESRSFVL